MLTREKKFNGDRRAHISQTEHTVHRNIKARYKLWIYIVHLDYLVNAD